MKTLLKFIFVLLFSFSLQGLFASTGEIVKSGDTWISTIGNDTVYKGSDMIDAINACTENINLDTINVRNSGTAVAPSELRSVNLNSNQTLDFHGNTMICENELNIYPVKASGKSNVTVRNMRIEGVPRYILHFNACSGITLTNISAHTTRGTGIRVEYSSNLVINGDINLHSVGHSIETMGVDTVNIGTVRVQADKGCGVLLNDSWECYIDTIYAKLCDYGQSYAGFRQANDNGTTHCKYLRADSCGRGLYVLTRSSQTTIDSVYITNCSEAGISTATTSSEVFVKSGTIINSVKNVDIWDGATFICINVNDSAYGDGCIDLPIGTTTLWFEPECANVGNDWDFLPDTSASNDTYVTVKEGKNSSNDAPGSNGQISITFNTTEFGLYKIWTRVKTPSDVDDSFWLKMDESSWYRWNAIGPFVDWSWAKGSIYLLTPGSHTLTIAYREDGALLDKIYISNTGNEPMEEGDEADVCNVFNNIASLSALSIDGVALNPLFNTSTYIYNIELDSETTEIDIEAVPTDGRAASVSGDGVVTLDSITDSVIVLVTANDGLSTQTYSIFYSYVTSVDELIVLTPNIYPLPAQDYIHIRLQNNDEMINAISIYSLEGRKILTIGDINSNQTKIDLSEMHNGIYIIQMDTNKRSYSSKFNVSKK